MIWKIKLFCVTVKYDWKIFVLNVRRMIHMAKYRLYKKLVEEFGEQ